MSITSCREFKTTTGHFVGGKDHKREYSRTWLAISDDAGDGAIAVYEAWRTATGLDYGSSYAVGTEYDTACFLQEIEFHRDGDDGLNWIVSAQYRPYPFGSSNDCPWLQPAKWNWSFNKMSENYDVDTDNVGVTNTAGDPFNNPLVRDRGGITLSVSQAEQTFVGSTAYSYCNTINSGSWSGAAARTLKLTIGASNSWDQKWGAYWNVTYTFEYNPRTWDDKVLDCGFLAWNAGNTKKAHILDGNKLPVVQPVVLDGAGHIGNPAAPHWLTFKPYEAVSFSSLVLR